MDYRKLGAGLIEELSRVPDPDARALTVFVQTTHPADHAEAAFLKRLGVNGARSGRTVFTATLSLHAIEELSEQSWVQAIKPSRTLHLLPG